MLDNTLLNQCLLKYKNLCSCIHTRSEWPVGSIIDTGTKWVPADTCNKYRPWFTY